MILDLHTSDSVWSDEDERTKLFVVIEEEDNEEDGKHDRFEVMFRLLFSSRGFLLTWC
jgi:hypothetical protein